MSKAQPLDLEALLKGTEYDKQAQAIARQAANAGLADKRFINDLPRLGIKVGGQNVYDVLKVILRQIEASEAAPEPEETTEEVVHEWTATLAAETLADEHGLDLSTVEGTGKDGAIIKSDIENLIA
jgi:pyruvate/2-oxoglutarate dehydrogenase complex dihydrolipoamide acyltransferase (E2) component